jgi:eukaryotic-like serine/threonine-protein kinase
MASLTLAERYRLQDLLSTSEMAEVRTATDLVLERRVVVKLLAPDADRPRFEREAQAVAALAHPNIVQLFDYGEEAGRPYIVFEYLPGGSLEERLDSARRFPDEETARIGAEVAAGLAHAHARGVVHRDMKPGNVLFDLEGRAKIADFGIARISGANTITKAGMVLGTAAYISPEQAAGEPAVPASDVYSFGVLLYRLLSGRLPFEAQSPIELAAMHRDADVPPLASIRPDAAASLARLAMSALAKRPEARPADGAALLDALDFGQRERIGSEDETEVVDARPPKRRLSKPLIAGGSLALLTITGFLGALLMTNEPASAPAVSNGDSPSHSTPQTSSSGVSVISRESSSRSSSTSSSQTETTSPATTASRSTVGSTTVIPPPPSTSGTTTEGTEPDPTAILPTSTATP